jgi:hypothetical protein
LYSSTGIERIISLFLALFLDAFPIDPLLLLFLDALAGLPMVVLAPLPLLLVLACTAAVAAIPTRIIIGANYVPCVFLLLAALRCQPSSRQQIYWQHWLSLAGRSSRDQRQHTHTDAGSQTDP